MRFEIAVAARLHRRESITAPRRFDRHLLNRFFNGFGVVDRAHADARQAAERVAVERSDAGLEVDRTDTVLLAFLDLEGHEEALALRIILRQRGDDLDVGIAVLEVIPAQNVAIGLDAVRIIGVVGTEEAEEVGFTGLDHVPQAVGRIGLVADELDRLHAGLYAFGDLEDQIDAIVRLLDDLGLDLDVVTAVAAIDFGDARGI